MLKKQQQQKERQKTQQCPNNSANKCREIPGSSNSISCEITRIKPTNWNALNKVICKEGILKYCDHDGSYIPCLRLVLHFSCIQQQLY